MKKISILVSLMLASSIAYSQVYTVVVCDNLSEDFPEDSLVIDFYRNTATYFDNDKDNEIPCSTLDNGITLCSDGHWTISIPKGGENTTVFEGKSLNRKIPFDCKH